MASKESHLKDKNMSIKETINTIPSLSTKSLDYAILEYITKHGTPDPSMDYQKSIDDLYSMEYTTIEDIADSCIRMEEKGWIDCYIDTDGKVPIVSGITLLSPGIQALVAMKKGRQKMELENVNAEFKNTYGCFLFDNKEHFMDAIKEFTDKCIANKLIPNDTDYKTVAKVFEGQRTTAAITWIGPLGVLTYIIKKLTERAHPILTIYPKGKPKWEVVSIAFRDKEGKNLPDIHKRNLPKKQTTIANELIDVFKSW